MKYFFLTEGWTVGRVWASDGLWTETAWRRQPDIQKLSVCLVEDREKLWLYRVEDTVLTVEVKPVAPQRDNASERAIGQVVLKRLIDAEQVIERLGAAKAICQLTNIQSVTQ